jgi:hypothetical protein
MGGAGNEIRVTRRAVATENRCLVIERNDRCDWDEHYMLSDVIRLTDEDIEKTFQLCYATLVDEDKATLVASKSISAISLEADEERSRLKRLLRKRLSRKVDAEEIEINYQYLLQRIVLEKTRHFEKAQEKDARERAFIHEDTWLLRYFKQVISFSSSAEHVVTSAYCRVIHDYSREITQRVHTFLIQGDPAESKGLEEFSKWKRRIDSELKGRFKGLLNETKEKGNIRRFIQRTDAEEKKQYVINCLKLFNPWGMSCALPVSVSEFSQVQSLKRHGNDPISEQAVKDRRIATVSDYECFSRLMNVFDGSAAFDHLLIPQFVLPHNGINNPTPPADVRHLPKLSSQRRDKIRNQAAEQSIRRERLTPRWLRIMIDGEMGQELYDLYTSRQIHIALQEQASTVEVWAIDSDTMVPFSFKTLEWLKPASPRAKLFTTKLEAGQKISWEIIYRLGSESVMIPSTIRIRYRETNWSRALSFYVKRFQDMATPRMIPQKVSDTLHVLLLENARVMDLALHSFAILILAIVVLLIGNYALKSRQIDNIAGPNPPLTLPSPSPNGDAFTQLVTALNDGSTVVGLDSNGRVQGLPVDLTTAEREMIEEALRTQRVSVAELPRELKSKSEGRMGTSTEVAQFTLIWPVGKIVRSRRPRLVWTNLSQRTRYRVQVFDNSYDLVSESQGYVKTTTWRIPRGTDLRPGGIYIWKVIATSNGTDEPSGLPSLPSATETFAEAKFKVLESSKAREIERVKKVFPNSHLLLGLAFARVGLIDEAEREFRSLASANPESELAQSFLNQLKRGSR